MCFILGPIVELIHHCNHAKNTLILTDPRFSQSSLLSCYPNLRMQVAYHPIDLKLRTSDLPKLVKKIAPGKLYIPSHVTSELSCSKLKKFEFTTLYGDNQYIPGFMTQALASTITPKFLNPVSNVATAELKCSVTFNGHTPIADLFSETKEAIEDMECT